MPLFDLITGTAERLAGKTAYIFADQSINFGTLYLYSRQVASRLQKLGIGPGARVAILHENALVPLVYFWGILASGAQVVDIPCMAGVGTVDEILAECKPAAIVVSGQQHQRLLLGGAQSLPRSILMDAVPATTAAARSYHALLEIVASESPEATLPEIHDSSIALIVY